MKHPLALARGKAYRYDPSDWKPLAASYSGADRTGLPYREASSTRSLHTSNFPMNLTFCHVCSEDGQTDIFETEVLTSYFKFNKYEMSRSSSQLQ